MVCSTGSLAHLFRDDRLLHFLNEFHFVLELGNLFKTLLHLLRGAFELILCFLEFLLLRRLELRELLNDDFDDTRDLGVLNCVVLLAFHVARPQCTHVGVVLNFQGLCDSILLGVADFSHQRQLFPILEQL